MKSIPLAEFQKTPSLYTEIATILNEGGIICFPAPAGYKLAANLTSSDAVTTLIQAKRRVRNAPSLVFVPDISCVDQVAATVSDKARRLMTAFWPGPLTLLFEANEELPSKVRKSLTKAKGWVGVRMPDDEVSRGVVQAFGRPILVTSANLAEKHGAHSVAQVRKNFGRSVELMIDAGDLSTCAKSTLVNVTAVEPVIVRAEALTDDDIQRALA